jgi:UDP-3-O-[3-hydroxymyristoyl] glucosamine N-acyltransferase
VIVRLAQLAVELGARVIGPSDRTITSAGPFDRAGADALTFIADAKHLRKAAECRATACLVVDSAESSLPADSQTTWLLVSDPLDAFIKTLKRFRPERKRAAIGVSPHAYVSPRAKIGPNTNIYPGAFIDDGAEIGGGCDIHPGVTVGRDCRIGEDCTIHPRVTLYDDVIVGDRVIVHAGAVLGADGFGYRFRNHRFEKIPQLGHVRIENDCEIGANTTIDRGMIGPTVIGEGTKLDNMVMIGHNCELGKHNVFASQVGLAGSVTTGDYVRCAGQVGIADHLHLGTGSTVGAKSGIHKNVPDGDTQVGYPALPEQEAFKVAMATVKLPEMRKQLRELTQRVDALAKATTPATTTDTSVRKAG